MKIGYHNDTYPHKRNIIDILPNANYVKLYNPKKRNIFNLGNKVLRRRLFNTTDSSFSFRDFDLNRFDLMHFFNAISFGTTPWVTTFESIVPRFKCTLSCHHGCKCGYSSLMRKDKILKALEAISSDSCKKLIAMSQCNLRMQIDFLRHFPGYHSGIERKLTHLYPPQKLLVDDYKSKKLSFDGKIRFMFVGAAFFRKGGIELLESFREARRKSGYDLKLIIVSSLTIDNYATKEKKRDVEKARKLIHENRDFVEYHGRLDNQRVLELMKTAHVGVLPTYADTFGYSVLEFQAAGCPVISTNVRALPEINNNKMGWIIEVPKNRLGEAIYTSTEDRAKISNAIKKGLTDAIADIMKNRQSIYRKANASINHIKAAHSPEVYAKKLAELYRCSL